MTLNEQITKMKLMMGLNKKSTILTESKKKQATNILKNGGETNTEEILSKFIAGDESNNQKNLPVMAYWYVNGYKNIDSIISVVNEYNDLNIKNRIDTIQLNKRGLFIGNTKYDDFLRFSEYIHSQTNEYKKDDAAKVAVEEFKSQIKPMWSGNGIDIYYGDKITKCIAYTQGGLTGEKYRFCIGQYGVRNMYKSYRDRQESTFYFIVDKNKFKKDDKGNVLLDDPLHIVVFDVTNRGVILTDKNNNTGTIAEYGTDVNGYIDYLKSKGVPVEKMVNKPKTEQEKYEDDLLGYPVNSLEWFINLDNPKNPKYRKPELDPGQTAQNYYKSAYIGRGHLLTNDQFDYLINNM